MSRKARICLIRMGTMVFAAGMLLSGTVLFAATAPQSGNLWIDGGSGSCTRSATAAAYNSSTACSSMQAAQNAAQAGDTVMMKNGTYSSQTISSGQKSSAVTYVAESPGLALVGSLEIDIDHVHTLGIIASGTGESRGSVSVCSSSSAGNCASVFTDVVFDGFHGKSAFLRGSGIIFQNGEIGGASGCKNLGIEDAFRFWGGSGANATPSNDKLLNSVIHDWAGGTDGTCDGTVSPTPHLDCFQSQGGANITMSGNTFYNCPSSNIQAYPFSGSTISNWTIENNFFGVTQCCNSISLGVPSGTAADCSTLTVRYNVMYDIVNSGGCSTATMQEYGNIYPVSISTCTDGDHNQAFSFDIFPASGGTTCGSNAKRCTVTWAKGALPTNWGSAQPDLHLASSDTCAMNAGNPSAYPATDMYGDARPQGSGPDAGPDEYVASNSGISPPTGLTAVVQ